jgi:nondiscriminating glutamyl-tRNA synthetase
MFFVVFYCFIAGSTMIENHSIRVRFAPSPTGVLHVGGARTALFNFLYARHHGGRFLIRIEDTDRKRSRPEHTAAIFNSMQWLGLNWDEPPVRQSDRMDRHLEICENLFKTGHAYPCFCSPELLESKRERARQENRDTRYDRTCFSLSADEIRNKLEAGIPHTLRFRVPDGITRIRDLVYGDLQVKNEEIDDFIIRRSDGSPVYQIAVITDDHDMAISHIIRGDDHLPNTPKQIMLYQALGWPVPQFAHLPLILGPDKKRLSKRHGAMSVEAYRETVLPETLVNFLALLGWSPGDDREIMDLNTLCRLFTLDRISRKPAIFDFQKLEWMSGHYLSQVSDNRLIEILQDRLQELGWLTMPANGTELSRLNRILDLLKPRMKTLQDFFQAGYFFTDPDAFDRQAVQKLWAPAETVDRMRRLVEAFQECEDWEESVLENLVRKSSDEWKIGVGKLIHPIRLALTGRTASPGLFEVMAVLGKETVIRRMKQALKQWKTE